MSIPPEIEYTPIPTRQTAPDLALPTIVRQALQDEPAWDANYFNAVLTAFAGYLNDTILALGGMVEDADTGEYRQGRIFVGSTDPRTLYTAEELGHFVWLQFTPPAA